MIIRTCSECGWVHHQCTKEEFPAVCDCCGTPLSFIASSKSKIYLDMEMTTEEAMEYMKTNRKYHRKKKKWVAVVLALLFGGIGVHKFYLDRPLIGIVYVLFFLFGLAILTILVSAIEAVILLIGTSPEEFDRKYNSKLCLVGGGDV